MKATTFCSLLAGFACAIPTLAQDAPLNMGLYEITSSSDGGFTGRSQQIVWGTTTMTGGTTNLGYNTAAFPSRAANDFDFAGGPAGTIENVTLLGAYWGVTSLLPMDGQSTLCDVRVSVFPTFTGWVDGTFPGGPAPAIQTTYPNFVANNGFLNFYPNTTLVAFDPPGAIPNTAGTDGMFMIEVFMPGTTTLYQGVIGSTTSAFQNAIVVGGSNFQRWGDATGPGGVGPGDGLVQPLTTTGTALEVNTSTTNGGRAIYGGLWGDVPPPGCVGCNGFNIGEGIFSRSVTISLSGVRWYTLHLLGNATDNELRFVDIDSEGSQSDVSMCVYNDAGEIVGYPGDNDGSGVASQLSFGVGRRAGVGDGAQYDGRMGNLSQERTYYIAIAVDGTMFGPGFSVTPPPMLTPQDAIINVRANLLSGNNGPSVPPVLNGVAFNNLMPGTNSGVSQTHTGRSINAVRWSQFTLTNCVSTQGGYVDIEFASLSDTVADVVAWIFDSDGNIVAFSDDAGGSNKPQFSFGSASPARPAPAGSTQTFAGQNGHLPYGTYYIATALYDADNSDLSFLPTDHRWHVRGAALSTLNAGTKINYAFNFAQQCPLPTCDSIDFNNDESLFDPIDLDAFLSVYSEGSCVPVGATCNDIDYNNDGSIFDPCDINSFLLVFSEGPCSLCGQ